MFQVFIAVPRMLIHSATTTVLQQAHKSCETTINLIVVTVKVKVWALHFKKAIMKLHVVNCKLQKHHLHVVVLTLQFANTHLKKKKKGDNLL